MIKFKALYYAMKDDLKDAEEMICDAYKIKESNIEDTALADEFAKYAQFRVQHFEEFHKLFEAEAQKHEPVNQETVAGFMWSEAHKDLMCWHSKIEKMIKEY